MAPSWRSSDASRGASGALAPGRSVPYVVRSCAMRQISLVPPSTSSRASRNTDSGSRLRCGPRSLGMMQNAHGRSHPSAILTYALCGACDRRRGEESSYRYAGVSATASRLMLPSIALVIAPTSSVPRK